MSKNTKAILALMVILIAAAGLFVYYLASVGFASAKPEVTHVERIFVDVDGDGQLDLLLEGDVIFNSGPLARP